MWEDQKVLVTEAIFSKNAVPEIIDSQTTEKPPKISSNIYIFGASMEFYQKLTFNSNSYFTKIHFSLKFTFH